MTTANERLTEFPIDPMFLDRWSPRAFGEDTIGEDELFTLLDIAADAKSNLAASAERFPILARRSAAIGEFRALLRELDGKILPDGSVADNASVDLHPSRQTPTTDCRKSCVPD